MKPVVAVGLRDGVVNVTRRYVPGVGWHTIAWSVNWDQLLTNIETMATCEYLYLLLVYCTGRRRVVQPFAPPRRPLLDALVPLELRGVRASRYTTRRPYFNYNFFLEF